MKKIVLSFSIILSGLFLASQGHAYDQVGIGTGQDQILIATDTVVLPPYCGDGNKGSNEECDDGNQVDGDSCSNQCKIQFIYEACGDGTKQSSNNEECDDGNNLDGDGCSHDCKIELPPPPVDQPKEQTQPNPGSGPQVVPNPEPFSASFEGSGCSMTTLAGGSWGNLMVALIFGLIPMGTRMIRRK